jgi:hypothetical protein
VIGGVTDCPFISFHHLPLHEDSWTLLDARIKEGKCSVIAMLVDKETLGID